MTSPEGAAITRVRWLPVCVGMVAMLALVGIAVSLLRAMAAWGEFFREEELPIVSLAEAERVTGLRFGPEATLAMGRRVESRDARAWLKVVGGKRLEEGLKGQAVMRVGDGNGEIARVFQPDLSRGRHFRFIGGPNLTASVLVHSEKEQTTAYVYWTKN